MKEFGKMEFRGKTAYVYDGRLTQEEYTVLTEKGYHVYGIRHDDDDIDIPRTVEPNVIVNFYGLMVIETALKFPQRHTTDGKLDEYLELDEQEAEDIESAAYFLNGAQAYVLTENGLELNEGD